jgi:GH15 family glucan-1,4-alpha-glucosidase
MTMRVALLLMLLTAGVSRAQPAGAKRPWKGYAILGNGRLTAVYSDDTRITGATHATGIQHFYFRDYTTDYIASTSFHLLNQASQAIVGMKNFFTTQTQTALSDGSTQSVLCFVHPDDAAVLSLSATGTAAQVPYRFEAHLRSPASLRSEDNIAIAIWPNGTALAIAAGSPRAKISVSESSVLVTGEHADAEVLIVPGSSTDDALSKARTLRSKPGLEASAKDYWEAWMNAGRLPAVKDARYLEAYKRNLYCVKAANLNGQIPADSTGQFVTNNMPQLYPRDAMMCARVLLLTGHAGEARQVVEFWASRHIPMKSVGEWYARYDAYGKAVDAGSGARFDEPEWDANGYFIYLLTEYHRLKGVWLADPKLFFELADFLVNHISLNGLLQEGGIVEWTGYLPATNMICAAALQNAAKIAREFGNDKKGATYAAASQRISAALPQMFDESRQTYADVRSIGKKGKHGESIAGEPGEKTYLWDTTANVGAIWGYPNHRALQLSNVFYDRNTVKLGGGMQYFDSPDPGLADYGHADFFFTTAAAAQYQSMYGDNSKAKQFLDWMLANANCYGLMPERILPDGSDCSPASPLSWCCAEFAAALLLWSQH